MPSCAVKWCGKHSKTSSYKKDGITFHRFPKIPELKEKWIDKVNRENWFPTKYSAICSRHFTPDCFEYLKQRRRLFSSAIPTLFLPILASTNSITDSNVNIPGPSHHNIALALCVTVCLAYNSPSSNEESAREFIEHVLRIPNSARGRLERSRQQEMIRQRVTSDADCEDPAELLPEYTANLQGSRELRQLGAQKHYPICHLERKIKKLNTNEYEYRPAYYEEVRCTTSSDDVRDTNEICSSLGFACVQWNKTIHLTRRRYTSDCWETSTMVIPAGCECMWPVHRLGDMNLRV